MLVPLFPRADSRQRRVQNKKKRGAFREQGQKHKSMRAGARGLALLLVSEYYLTLAFSLFNTKTRFIFNFAHAARCSLSLVFILLDRLFLCQYRMSCEIGTWSISEQEGNYLFRR